MRTEPKFITARTPGMSMYCRPYCNQSSRRSKLPLQYKWSLFRKTKWVQFLERMTSGKPTRQKIDIKVVSESSAVVFSGTASTRREHRSAIERIYLCPRTEGEWSSPTKSIAIFETTVMLIHFAELGHVQQHIFFTVSWHTRHDLTYLNTSFTIPGQ